MASTYYTPYTPQSGQITGTLTDWPAFVYLDGSRYCTVGNGGHVIDAQGDDLVPYPTTGLVIANKLDFEIDITYNASAGTRGDWVRIPSASTSTTIYYGYGDNTITTDQSNATGVWDSNYLLVAHFKDGSTLSTLDSTSNANNANQSTATATTGQIGGAAAFDGNIPQTIRFPTTIDPAAITVQAWVYSTSWTHNSNSYNTVFGKRPSPDPYNMLYVKSSGKLAVYVKANSDRSYDGVGSHTLATSTIYALAYSYDSSVGLIGYVNAEVDSTVGANGLLQTNSGDVYLSLDFTVQPRAWDGWMDEVRVSSIARASAWIEADYNSQYSQSTFWGTIQAEVPVGGGSLINLDLFIEPDYIFRRPSVVEY